MFAPICLFTYNRLEETIQTLEALKKNYLASESELFIFSDGPKNEQVKLNVNEVREYLHSISGFKKCTIFESDNNKGLANSIISGISQIIDKSGKVIVLEDDLITSPNFLNFMNYSLDFYQNEKNIQSINGFSLQISNLDSGMDIYFQTRPFSWGWATWSDRWDQNIFNKQILKFEINSNISILDKFKKECGDDIAKMLLNSVNDKNDSWYVRWAYSHFKNNRYSVYPTYSLIENIGFGKKGTHCKNINPYNYKIDKRDKAEFSLIKFSKPEKRTTEKFLSYFSTNHKIVIRLKLLKTSEGRNKLLSELMMKIKK